MRVYLQTMTDWFIILGGALVALAIVALLTVLLLGAPTYWVEAHHGRRCRRIAHRSRDQRTPGPLSSRKTDRLGPVRQDGKRCTPPYHSSAFQLI